MLILEKRNNGRNRTFQLGKNQNIGGGGYK